MVELALVAPFLIFLMIGLIEVGRYMYFGILAAHAAEAGAQYGSQSLANFGNTSAWTTAAKTDASGVTWTASPQPYCLANGAVTTCPTTGSTPAPGVTYYAKVTVSGEFKSLLSYPGIPDHVPVKATSIMRVLNQ